MARRSVPLLLLAIVCASGAPVLAQETSTIETPAHVSVVDGAAILERDGRTDSEPLSMPLLAGDRLRTQAGRLEVLFADGSALHLDEYTVVDFQSDEVVRLLEGRIRLSIAGAARDVSYRVDAPTAWVQVNTPGEYRVSILRNADVELAVLRGAAELVNEEGRSYVRAGERTFAREGASPTPPYVYNSAAWDAFDRWSEQRRDHRLGVSAQYLPSDVRPYAASFDQYGSWRHAEPYGYVWYPRVTTGWRPYYRGRWVSLRPYGWTWIAHDPWGWPTHHYGRWGFSAGAWFWIPGRHWGPAWVSWAYARDYVSWCPLGWNNRPVLQIVNVNVYGGRRWNPWDAWTVVPRGHFGRGYVNVTRIAAVRIDQRIQNTFMVRNAAPETRYAVGRTATPIRSAGRFAVPRSGSAATYATAAGGARSATQAGGRRFPDAARPPRTPSAVQPGPVGEAQRSNAARAVPRAGTAPTAVSPRAGPSFDDRASDSRQYRRAPDAVRPRATTTEIEPPSSRSVTAAPAGAVRAMPRTRERSQVAPVEPGASSSGRTRAREERLPAYGAAAPPAPPARPAESAPRYRSNPGYRSAPDRVPEYRERAMPPSRAPGSAPGYRERAMPRSGAPAAPPSYRAAPEQRRGPSGPPPAASAPPSRESGDGTSGARSRPRGADAQPSGQGRRRR